jgi:hypothetical protein
MECQRQAALVAASEQHDSELADFLDAAITDLDQWK